MNEKECDIIKDLLPSYVDGICSEASREWVERHLEDCENCKQAKELLAATELSGRKLEEEGLEAAKKIKLRILGKNQLGYLASILVLLLMTVICRYNQTELPVWVPFAALPVCILWYPLISSGQPVTRVWGRQETIGLAGAIVSMVYGSFIMLYCVYKLRAGSVFDMEPLKTGPFLRRQVLLVAAVLFGLFLWQVVKNMKKGRGNSLLINLCLTGTVLMLTYDNYLGRLQDWEAAWEMLRKETWIILGIGAAFSAGIAWIERYLGKKTYREI